MTAIAAEELTSTAEEPGDFAYRSLSTGAIGSLIVGVLSPLVFIVGRDNPQTGALMCLIPLVGAIVGLRALAAIKANPDQLTGRKMALAGVVLSALCMAGGLAFSSYSYATEVPPGYARTSFEDLRPDEVDQRGGVLVPANVAQLNGQKVFIKGYFRPGSSDFDRNAKRFLLVRDNNTCCFGDLSAVKYFDQVAVQLVGRKTVNYSPSVFRIGGTLHVAAENAQRGAGRPVFSLEADYVVE
jgi:hypothetical protein